MQFVAFHNCGRIQEPFIKRCPAHRQVAVRLPGTAAARELHFYCPTCNMSLSEGFPFQRCECGAQEGMEINVHRARRVFVPHFTVLVNPPDPAEAARFRASGGGARALNWVLEGMTGDGSHDGQQTLQGLEDMLIQQGMSPEFAKELAERAADKGEVVRETTSASLEIPHEIRNSAQEEAISLTSALQRGRVRIEDMANSADPPLRTLYESRYRAGINLAGLSNVELLTDFPVTTLAFGFTRGGDEPSETKLVPFREQGGIRVYGLQAHTEALLFQLDPVKVIEYLSNLGFDLPGAQDERSARVELLKSVHIPSPRDETGHPLGIAVLELLHSYTHRLVRSLATSAGIERDGLSEYLLPHHLSAIVYAAARGEFVLGGLQSVFETTLHSVLDAVVYGEGRCPLDPGCRSGGAACMACLHLGEPSCRWFNRFLDRRVLFGKSGFLVGR